VPSYLPAWRYGGPIHSVHGLCGALAAQGHEIHVFTTNVNGSTDSDVPLGIAVDIDGVQVWYFPSKCLRRLYYSPLMKGALKTRIKEFDLVHLHSVFLWPMWVAAGCARRAHVPYVIAPRGMLVAELIREKNKVIKKLSIALFDRRVLKGATAIHFTTEREKADCLALGINVSCGVVVPNGIDISEIPVNIRNSKKKNTAKPYILYFGRINWKKGIDRLIRAMQFLPEARVNIVGNDEEAYLPTLKLLAHDLGVRNQVKFHGPAKLEKKWEWITGASVLVLPSRSENFGNVVLEAMAVGVPVVVTPEVGLADTVKRSGAGIVADGNPESIATAIKKIIHDRKKAHSMSEAGRHTVETEYTWENVAGQMEEAYQGVLRTPLRE